MFSQKVSVVLGVTVAQLFSAGLWLGTPTSRAAWSWQCTYYTGKNNTQATYMDVNATTGPTCADGKRLNCTCSATPCDGPITAMPTDLSCAGMGSDAGGCYKLHQTYGTAPVSITAAAGRGTGTQVNACGEAALIKVFGNGGGLDSLVSWAAITTAQNDSSSTPANAAACQAKCAANAKCTYWTFNDRGSENGTYDYFRGLCYLMGSLSCTGEQYSQYHGMISGPKVCPPAPKSDASGAAAWAPMSSLAVVALLGRM